MNAHIDTVELIDSRIFKLHIMPLEDLEKWEISLKEKARLLINHPNDLSEAFYEDLVNELTDGALTDGTQKKFN